MKKFWGNIAGMLQGITLAVTRFPLTMLCLLGATGLACHLISLRQLPGLLEQKMLFVFLFGAFLGVAAQFACERFQRLALRRWLVYAVALLFTCGYYLIIAQAPAIDFEVGARTAVAVFSLFCAFIWLPSYRGTFDFNSVALIHFKSALTSVLYAGVLSAGLAALIAAVDLLLFDLDSELFGYMLSIVWITFAPSYYLSRLPRFNSEELQHRMEAEEASQYPRILDILVSQIAIPLMAAYTLVLLAYFIKIGLSQNWPIGQLGPMILAYSAAGLLVYILASRLGNRFALIYQRVFPKVLIPIVVMQLFSVSIRLRAYGITESRYYVTLFGVFSLVVGVVLSLRPITKNGMIALLAAAFAMVSVVPPVDAFTVSRISQVARLEQMLQAAGMLTDGQVTAKPDVDQDTRRETTSILAYLDRRDYLQQVSWLPADFELYRDMEETFGFGPTYVYEIDQTRYFSAFLDPQQIVPISGYDILLEASTHRWDTTYTKDFTVHGEGYKLVMQRVSAHEVLVSIQDGMGAELVSTGLYNFVGPLREGGSQSKDRLSLDQMTLDVAGDKCKLRVIFQSINGVYDSAGGDGTDYSLYILAAILR